MQDMPKTGKFIDYFNIILFMAFLIWIWGASHQKSAWKISQKIMHSEGIQWTANRWNNAGQPPHQLSPDSTDIGSGRELFATPEIGISQDTSIGFITIYWNVLQVAQQVRSGFSTAN